MPKPARYRHLSRIDDERSHTHAWRVQVQRKGKVVIQYFSDNLHGGKRKALRAALACRDELLEQMHGPDYALWRRNRKRRNNTSGAVGIGRYAMREMVDGRQVERLYWQAFWDGADGKRRSRKFSVKKYGDTRAKALARAARREALAALL